MDRQLGLDHQGSLLTHHGDLNSYFGIRVREVESCTIPKGFRMRVTDNGSDYSCNGNYLFGQELGNPFTNYFSKSKWLPAVSRLRLNVSYWISLFAEQGCKTERKTRNGNKVQRCK